MNKIRCMGETVDPNKQYDGRKVIALIKTSFENGKRAGYREGYDEGYEKGYERGFQAATEEMQEDYDYWEVMNNEAD